MFKRFDVRNTCFKKAKNAVYSSEREYIVEYIEEKVKLPNDKWEDFSKSWDVFVTKDEITRIVPETSYDFVHSTCIEIQTKKALGQESSVIYASLSPRQKNIYDVVDLNYLGEEIDWAEYNKSWIIEINHQTKRIEVKNLNTKVNEVTFEEKKDVTDLQAEMNTELEMNPVDEKDLSPALVEQLKKLLSTNKE